MGIWTGLGKERYPDIGVLHSAELVLIPKCVAGEKNRNVTFNVFRGDDYPDQRNRCSAQCGKVPFLCGDSVLYWALGKRIFKIEMEDFK